MYRRQSVKGTMVNCQREIEMSPSGSGGLWALVENPLWGFPRSGGRGLCVHGSGSDPRDFLRERS